MLTVTNAGRLLPPGSTWLWRNLSFDIRGGTRLSVEGPTGVGKTLLLRALAGLDRLDEGTIALDDRPMREWSPPAYRARICYLHQRPALLEGTVEENLARVFALEVHRHKRFDRSQALTLLEAMGRKEAFLKQPATNLSGGESQVAALVRALLTAPQILLLDEPTASLDAETASRAERVIHDWLDADPSRAALWTSHDPAVLERFRNERLVLQRGTP